LPAVVEWQCSKSQCAGSSSVTTSVDSLYSLLHGLRNHGCVAVIYVAVYFDFPQFSLKPAT